MAPNSTPSRPADPVPVPPMPPLEPAPATAPNPSPVAPFASTLPDTGTPKPIPDVLNWEDEPANKLPEWTDESIVGQAGLPVVAESPLSEAGTAIQTAMGTRGELGQIGQYRLIALIGEGGMGLVYKAEDIYLKRTVALKVMKPDLAKDEQSWKLFWNEARATAALHNPRIATIYQVGEADKTMFLAMELLKGKSLERRLQSGPLTLLQALWV